MAGKVRLVTAASAYITSVRERGRDQRTIDRYDTALGDFLEFLAGQGLSRLHEVRMDHVLAYSHDMLEHGYSASSIRVTSTVLRGLLRHSAQRWKGQVDASLMDQPIQLSTAGARGPTREPFGIEAKELKRLRKVASKPHEIRDLALLSLQRDLELTSEQLKELPRKPREAAAPPDSGCERDHGHQFRLRS